jgi:FemAB-related protein (PEP-CTERM system-associated)
VTRSPATAIALLDGRESAWDACAAAPGGTFCHLVGWRGIMADALGHECRYLMACDDDGAVRAVLPLVRVRSRLFGDYLVSMPFLNAGGAVGTPDGVAGLLAHAVELARRLCVDLLELRARRPAPGEGPLRVTSRKITVRLELPESADALWRGFDAKLRSQIRRPQKEGLTAAFGNDQVEPFYEVFARNMRCLGTPVLPRRFFERIGETFAGIVVFGAVYRGAEPVAAGCGFVWGDEFEMTWASSLREHNRLASNMLLYWSFLEHAIGRGVRVFDFGRCTPGSGTHRFKRQWGAVDVALPWLQWSARNVTAPPSPDRPAFRLASAVWRRLPLAVTNRIGPVLARRIP